MRVLLKRIQARFFVMLYNIIYYRRWSIHCGRIGNRIEISKKEYGNTHKFFVSYPLKTIKL